MSAENASLPSAGGPQPPASLTCVICAMLIEGAVSTSCGHEFCCACLLTYIELPGGDPTNRPCPVCRARIQYAHPSYGMRRLAAEFADDPRT
ncbi:MAG: RING-HC finger protein, partial [archaeon]|nr:RING-HC finger protein [archaeon]